MALLTVTRNTLFKRTPAHPFLLPFRDKLRVSSGMQLQIDQALQVGQHCFVTLKQPLGSIGKVGYFFLPHVAVSLSEMRGVWLTNVDSDVLYSRSQIETGLQQLKQLGFTTIYPAVWQRGYTLYPSSVAETFTGRSITPDSHFANRDMLAELVEIAKAYELKIVPWFEYGLAAPPNSRLHLKNPHLISLDQRGEAIRIKSTDGKPDQFVWLNPCRPEVQQFMVDLITDVVTRYPVDGIQLDDHFSSPIELGYDPFTQDLYQAETRRPMPQTAKDPQRIQWGTAKMTHLLSQVVKAVKAKSEGLISVSPNPLAFSKSNYCVDWHTWAKKGLIDELVLQVYRDNMTSFIQEISKPEVIETQNHIPTAIGILTGIKTRSVSTRLIEQQLQEVRRRNVAGVSCFFYETLFHEQLSPSKVTRNPADLQRLFTT